MSWGFNRGTARRIAIPSILFLCAWSIARPQDRPAVLQPSGGSAGSEKPLVLDLGDGTTIELLPIPAGTFTMGGEGGPPDAAPPHRVTISRPFYLGRFEVTQRQWKALMGGNPAFFQGMDNPVESVDWPDCQAFVEKLNARFARIGLRFDLPTEAQWEYACRAGGEGNFSFGNDPGQLCDYAWFSGNSGGSPHAVGQKKPNAWGLYDMHGNVCEWCADLYDRNYYRKSPPTDPPGASFSHHRSIRGGSWEEPASNCRAWYRNMNDPSDRNRNLGLRVMAVQGK